jgi:hypothetical protein
MYIGIGKCNVCPPLPHTQNLTVTERFNRNRVCNRGGKNAAFNTYRYILSKGVKTLIH